MKLFLPSLFATALFVCSSHGQQPTPTPRDSTASDSAQADNTKRALIGLGIPEYEAKRYEGKVKEGRILISVHSENSDERKRAKSIFKEEGAHDVSSTGEAHADLKLKMLPAEQRLGPMRFHPRRILQPPR
jgi:hypothetical protein